MMPFGAFALLGFCAQERALLNGSPRGPASGRRISPQGRVQDARAFVAGTWTYRQRTPQPARAVSGQEPADRAARGVLSFGSFSLDKQRKGTGPQGCGTKTHGCG